MAVRAVLKLNSRPGHVFQYLDEYVNVKDVFFYVNLMH